MSAVSPSSTASLTVSAPPGPLSSGSMAGWPAAVAVIARNAMWMEARVGSANGSGRDNDRDTTSRAGRGVLTLAGVPIGRPEDAPPRLPAELATADVVAAEDTRRVRQLAAALNVTIAGRGMSYYDVIETRRAEQLAAELAAGKNVLVVTDAGMPGISDPGYRVVAAAVAAGGRGTRVPGAAGGGPAPPRPRPLRLAHRPVLLRGVPAAQARRTGEAVRRAGGRTAHPGVLRIAAP